MNISEGFSLPNSDTCAGYYEPTEKERELILKYFDPQGLYRSQHPLIRFNLNPNGIRTLLKDGAKHMDDTEYDAVRLLRGYMFKFKNKTFTIFWPGGLGIHNHMLDAIRAAFNVQGQDIYAKKYDLSATLSDSHGINKVFDTGRLDEFCGDVTNDWRAAVDTTSPFIGARHEPRQSNRSP